MRSLIIVALVCAVCAEAQFWKLPQDIFEGFSWLRQGKTGGDRSSTLAAFGTNKPGVGVTAPFEKTKGTKTTVSEMPTTIKRTTKPKVTPNTKQNTKAVSNTVWTTVPIRTQPTTTGRTTAQTVTTTSMSTETSTFMETTTQEDPGTTEEPRDNHHVPDFYLNKREKPQVKIASNISQVSNKNSKRSIVSYIKFLWVTFEGRRVISACMFPFALSDN
jgi:hypothetical protein